MLRDGNLNKTIQELPEPLPEPVLENQLDVLLFAIIGGSLGSLVRDGQRQRDLREERNEEGLDRDEGFKGKGDGGGRREEGEEDGEVVDVGAGREELVAEGFEVV